MSFVLVSHYLRAMGHSAKKKKRGGKTQKSVQGEWRLLVCAVR